MTVAELKLKLFRQIDGMEKGKLEELFGIFTNFINGKNDVSDWEKLSPEQQQGIFDAIDEIESGKGVQHEIVMANIRKKFTNA
jgi:hypothetical protein